MQPRALGKTRPKLYELVKLVTLVKKLEKSQ